MDKIPNKEAFNILVGMILANAIKTMPGPAPMQFENYDEEMEFEPEIYSKSNFFRDTVNWLEQFGYIAKPLHRGYGSNPYVITEKALIALNKRPEALKGESFGESISKAAKDIATDVGKKALSEQVGGFLGGFTKGFIS